MANYREPQWLLPNEKNLQYPAAGATYGSGLSADRHSLYSMDFGVNKDIELPNTLEVQPQNGDFTFSAWINPDSWSSSTYDGIYVTAGANGLWIGVGPVGGTQNFILRAYGVANYIEYNVLPSIGTWTHVCITRINNQATLYYNGVSVATGSANKNFSASAKTHIGSDSFNSFNGKIDEVAFWKGKGLSLQQVQSLSTSDNAPANIMALSNKPTIYYPLGEQARKPGTAEWRFPNEVLQGQAIDFDGSSDYITTDIIDLGTENSISFWFNQAVDGNTQFLIGSPDGANRSIVQFDYNRITIRPDGNTQFLGPYRSPRPPFNYPGVWGHYLITRNGNTVRLFVNGEEQAVSGSGTMSANTRINAIGAGLFPAPLRFIDGQLSNVVFWNSDQSDNIDNIYNYGAPQTSYTVTPTAWYKLDKTSKFTGLNPNWHSALEFVASESDYIDLGSSPTIFTDFTLSFWYKQRGAAGNFETVVGKDTIDGGILSSIVFTSGLLHFKNRPGSWTALTTTTASNTEFKHYSITYDSSANELKGYCNGNLEVTTTPVFSSATGNEHSFNKIGRYGSIYYLDGQLSNLAAFNQVISPEDIKYLYNGGTPQTNISFEPVSWWKLDNLTTGIQDSGSASNNGTNNGASPVTDSVAVDEWVFENAVQSQTPNWSSALDFNSTQSDFVNIPYNANYDLTGAQTVSFWFNQPTTQPGGAYPITFGSGSQMKFFIQFYDPIGRIITRLTDSTGAIVDTTNLGVDYTGNGWHHLAFTTDGTTTTDKIITYFDGEPLPVKGTLANAGLLSPTVGFNFGKIPNAGHFNGQMSNISYFDKELSASEIKTLYNSGQPETNISNSPIAWWKLNDTTIQDSAGSNNGTNNGATEIQTNVWTPRLNGESSTLPSSALTSSDLQFNSAYSSFSLEFNGVDDNLNVGDIDNSAGLSFSTWVSTTSTNASNYQNIAYKRNGSTGWFIQYLYSSGTDAKIKFIIFHTNGVNSGSEVTITNLQSGNWFNIALTYDGTDAIGALKLYSNGTEVYSNSSTLGGTGIAVNNDDLYLSGGATSAWFGCKMDETAIWNRALNQAEITSIYNNGYPKDLTVLSPSNWWRLGEDAYFVSPTFTVPNKITGGNNGTSSNLPATALVADAPGSYAAGLGSSLALADRLGEAPLSTANSLSFNMTPENRVSYPAGYVPTQVNNVYSMDFDGTNDYISTSNVRLGSTYSISLWFNADSFPSTNPVLISQYVNAAAGRFFLGVRDDGGGRKITAFSASHNYGSTVISTGGWYNVVLVNDNNTVTLYLNGSVDGNFTFSSAPPDTDILIGALDTTPSNPWDGNIDEVAIFDYALSARQIKQDIYNGTTSGKTADLNNISNLTPPVAWYRMGD